MHLVIFLSLTACTVGKVVSSFSHGPIALPVVLQHGYLADTHEVAAAKNAHLATLAQQSHGGSYVDTHHHGDLKFHGPTALPVVLQNGFLADTHDVAAAKNAHLATLAQQSHGGRYVDTHGHHHGDLKYHGPTALPVVHQNGFLADTHDVAAAKNAHLATLAQQSHVGRYVDTHSHHHGDLKYHGPTAVPQVLHDGHIADTHEVAAARAEHLSAVSKAQASAAYHTDGGYNSHQGNEHYSGTHHGFSAPVGSYHGLIANPRVLPSGYLADTREVSIAKHHHLHVLHSSQSVQHYGVH